MGAEKPSSSTSCDLKQSSTWLSGCLSRARVVRGILAAAARGIPGRNNGAFDIWLCLISAGSLWTEMSQGFWMNKPFYVELRINKMLYALR